MPRADPDIVAQIKSALRADVGRLAEELRNETPSYRYKHEWRWGKSGGFRVKVSGPKRGSCANFSNHWTGDPLKLIQDPFCTGVAERTFPEALEYASKFTGIGPLYQDQTESKKDPEAERQAQERAKAREKEREEKRGQEEAETAQDHATRIKVAKSLWAKRIPQPWEGIGDTYLTVTRATPIVPLEWPECVGVLPAGRLVIPSDPGGDGQPQRISVPYEAAVIVAATTPDGEITAVQRIPLTADAQNIRHTYGKKSKVKITNGVTTDLDSVVRLPGPANGPLLLAEGPETGLSLWACTGHETWIALGSLSNHRPPLDRQVVICRDDDQSQADRNLEYRLNQWRKDGVSFTVAEPWPVRRRNGSDFNDVLREEGPPRFARVSRWHSSAPRPPIG